MEKTKTTQRNKDHDDFVRGLFSYTEFVLKILNYSLPNDLKPFIDFSSLEKSSETHVDEVLQITYSDTIYTANMNKAVIPKSIRGRKQLPNFRFYFLGEFKSGIPDKPIDFQVDNYVKNVQTIDINNGRPPSIVIPILIYHGKRPWKHKRLYDYFAKYLPKVILDYIPCPKYIVIDLQAMTDADIAVALDLQELRAAFIALKHAHDKVFFQQNLEEIFKFAETSKPSLLFQAYLRMLTEYSQRRSKLEAKEFNEIVEQLKPYKEMGTRIKTIFEVAEEKAMKKGLREGKKEGKKEGIAIGKAEAVQVINETKRQLVKKLIQTGQFDNSIIANLVDVSLSLVEEISLELSSKKG